MDEVKVEVLGVPMTVSFSGSFFRRCTDQTRDTTPFIQHLVLEVLRQKEMADYMLHEVRFGEEVVICDSLYELSFVAQVTQTHIYVNAFLSEWGTGKKLRARAKQYQLNRLPDRSVKRELGDVA